MSIRGSAIRLLEWRFNTFFWSFNQVLWFVLDLIMLCGLKFVVNQTLWVKMIACFNLVVYSFYFVDEMKVTKPNNDM